MSRIYHMLNLHDEENISVKSLDYYIMTCGYSPRYDKALKTIYPNCQIDNLVIFDYKKLYPENDAREYLDRNIKEVTHIEYKLKFCVGDDDDVSYIMETPLNENSAVGVDITGFTVPDIFRIMYLLKVFKRIKTVYIFYSEPKHYLFKDNIFNSYEYLSGERTYNPIEEYFITGSTTKELLICFLGFDVNVSDYVYEKAMPSNAVAVNGFPSYLPKLKDISMLNNYSLLTNTVGPENVYYAKANNPYSAYNILSDISNNYVDHLLNICVLGSKPMALGACLFSLENERRVKVTYPYPERYYPQLSDEYSNCWCYVVELN